MTLLCGRFLWVARLLLLCGCNLAFQPSIHRARQPGIPISREIPTRSSTQLLGLGGIENEVAWPLGLNWENLGGWILALGVLNAIATFVFANVAYTPEILEGAKDLRREERQKEIAKILEAVQTHSNEGKEMEELRIALETALGKSLEDYVRAVLEEEGENEYSLYTDTDKELATLLKRCIV